MTLNFIIGKVIFKNETKFPGGFFVKIVFYGRIYYNYKRRMNKLIKRSLKLKKQFIEDLKRGEKK